MAATLSNDQGKRELEALLTKALESENVEDMEDLFHTIVDRSNQLRRQYGLPVRVDEGDKTSILKTNLEQLKLVDAKSEIAYGKAIMERAAKRSTRTGQPSLFSQAFISEEKATQIQSIVLNHIDHAMSVDKVIVFPPLLLRSAKQGRMALHVDEDLQISNAQAKPNLLFIFCDDGPIIPIVDATHMSRMNSLLEHVYPLTGLCSLHQFRHILNHMKDEKSN